MQEFILLLLNAGDEAIQSGIQAGLDIFYGNIKNYVTNSQGQIDDKLLQIVTDAITGWTPKN